MNIEKLEKCIEAAADWVWGFPMLAILVSVGIFFTIVLKFLPLRHIGLICSKTIGSLFKKADSGSGGVSPFQAFSTSLASTAGATNILGVPLAIAFGGPGALFWMWVIAIIGMSIVYSEIILGFKYREKRGDEWVGGPVHYIRKGLGLKWLAGIYAVGLLCEVFASTMVQTNAATTILTSSFGFNPSMIGIIIALAVGLLVFGGIKRISSVMEKLLPLLVLGYVILCIIIIFKFRENLLPTIQSIFADAFTPSAALGIFPGATILQTIRWGLARGLYTSETGMGTTAIANSASECKQPVEQGFWGIMAIAVDTLIICTLSGLIVLVTDFWTKLKAEQAPMMLIQIFKDSFGERLGPIFLSTLITFFVLATVGVIIYYGEKQVEYLFNKKAAMVARFIYLGAVYLGSIGALVFVWKLIDLILVLVVIPNVIAITMLYKEVKKETKDYIDTQKESKQST